jgi:predicted AlkP superfamily phosphohydrolase/phosphomutase
LTGRRPTLTQSVWSGIYLNFKGREAGEFWKREAKAERVRNAIQTGLADFPDAHTQRAAIRTVSRREELYSGAFVENSPDLLVNFHRGFRVSWASAVGAPVPFRAGRQYAPLEQGPHCRSGICSGILFMNRAASHQHARIIDLAPTILNYLGWQGPAHGRRVVTVSKATLTT